MQPFVPDGSSDTRLPPALPEPKREAEVSTTSAVENMLAQSFSQQSSSQAQMATVLDKLSARLESHTQSDARQTDKCNALIGLKLTADIPKFPDKDTNFERHWRQFSHVMDLQALGRQALRPMDILVGYKGALMPGSTRLRTYDTIVNRAQKNGLLPGSAMKVMEEITSDEGRYP